MKKSLIAFAALSAIAGSAQAQNVTMYGIIDMGVIHADGNANGSVTKAASGPLSTSRFGMRGTEDLGDGMKAGFNLEAELNAATGEGGHKKFSQGTGDAGTASLFNRAANVSLEHKEIGAITLGRMNRLEYDAILATDPTGGSNFGGANIGYGDKGAYIAKNKDSRYANAVKLVSPSLMGLKLSYQRSLGGVIGDESANSSDAFGADFSFEKLRLLATWAKNNDANGSEFDKTFLVAGSYDFAVAKLFAGYMKADRASTSADPKLTYVGLTAPVSQALSVFAHYNHITDQKGTSGADADTFALGALYDLSKRTTVYAMYGMASNNSLSSVGVGTADAPAVGKDQNAFAIGVRHKF